jgi:3D (Asp-Asp-Asp) domain-containing protein
MGQCAAPTDIPFGSKVYIPALGRTFIVTDRTHERFRRNTVDLFLPTEWACRQFGRRYLVCEFTRAERPAKYGALRGK